MLRTRSKRERASKGRPERPLRRSPSFRLVAFTISALVVMLFAESGARAVDERLPEPIEWYDENTQVQIEQMDRYNRKQQRADFVFAGTSMVFRGIDPMAFEEASREPTFAYNVGVLAGMPPIQQRWLLEEVEPRLKPRVVVYGMSSLDFQGRRYKFAVNSYESAPATRKGFMASAQRFGARLLKIVQVRAVLRDPDTLAEVQETPKPSGPIERTRELMDDRGHIPKAKRNVSNKERMRMRDSVLRDYKISARGTRQIERIIRTLERRDVTVILVSMPVPERYIEVHPRGADDFNAAERHIARLAGRMDLPVIDMSDSMPESSFADYTHLSQEGAVAFTRKLQRELHRLGV